MIKQAFFVLLICLVSIHASPLAALATSKNLSNHCQRLLLVDQISETEDDYLGRPVFVKNLAAPTKHLETITYWDLFHDSTQEVLFGFSNRHAYLIAGDSVLDGDRVGKTDVLPSAHYKINQSILFRFRNLPPETVKLIENYIKSRKGKFSLTCVYTILRALEKAAGIKIKNLDSSLLLQPTFRNITQNGFESKDGKPIEFEIISTFEHSMRAVDSFLGYVDRKGVKKWQLIGAGTAAGTAAVSGLATLIWQYLGH